jgi:hypothetical protein
LPEPVEVRAGQRTTGRSPRRSAEPQLSACASCEGSGWLCADHPAKPFKHERLRRREARRASVIRPARSAMGARLRRHAARRAHRSESEGALFHRKRRRACHTSGQRSAAAAAPYWALSQHLLTGFGFGQRWLGMVSPSATSSHGSPGPESAQGFAIRSGRSRTSRLGKSGSAPGNASAACARV